MIVASSRPRLSPSVHRNGNRMLDRASGRGIDLNDTARHIVREIDGRRSVQEIASALSERFGVEERRALDDATELIDALYRGGLVRARPPWRYRLAYLVATLRTLRVSVFRGGVFARKRVDVRGGFLAILAQVALHVCVRYWWLVAYLVLVGGSPFLLLGVGAAQTILAPLILCLVLLLGVSLHESAHLYVLRRRASDPWLGYLSFTSIKVGVRRPRIDRDELEHAVAVSGPLCPVICGVALIALNAVVYPSFLLAASGMLLTVHALSLLPPSSDGKKLFFYAQRQTEGYHER